DRRFTTEARPSDALALAVRTGAEICVEEELLSEVGPEVIKKNPEDPSPLNDEIARLQDELDDAVDNEDYEEAARLRDRLRDQIRIYEESMNIDDNLEQELKNSFPEDSDQPDDTE
ncbi:MAG: bifunctional nuclease domain-containing protein, partial [bacterium]